MIRGLRGIFLLLLVIAVVPAKSYGNSGIPVNFRLSGHGVFEKTQFYLNNGKSAEYTGIGFGAGFEIIVPVKFYIIGMYLGAEKISLNNSANSATQSETLDCMNYYVVPRIQAGNVFLGAGLRLTNSHLISKLSSSQTETKYFSYGGRVEAGVNIHFGPVFLSPLIHYDISNALPNDGSGVKRMESLDIVGTVGINF